jgi:light-regulated signal transduction histidine kinase (bacteriophytochrome)
VQLCVNTWNYSVQTGEPYHIEYRFKDYKTNDYKWFLGKALAVRDADGNIIKWFGTCTEIQNQKMISEELERKVIERTEDLKQTNAELERSNKDLEQFAYIASHDLQEPVRKILTFAEIIKEKNTETLDDQSRLYINKISNAAFRMKNIIKDILNFSHLNNAKNNFVATDLNKIVVDIKGDLELIITQKGATINFNTLPVVEALPVQMNQLFYNLINNALKFSKQDKAPVININAEKISESASLDFHSYNSSLLYIKITFEDNGIGFEQKYAQQIFNMFQRLNDKQAYSGTGIGLALCKKIIENHNGSIKAYSKEGEGSTFVVILPVTQPI